MLLKLKFYLKVWISEEFEHCFIIYVKDIDLMGKRLGAKIETWGKKIKHKKWRSGADEALYLSVCAEGVLRRYGMLT